MKNFVVHFPETHREAVLLILSRSNDIIINSVHTSSAGITIQLDEADEAYDILVRRIEMEVNPPVRVVEPGCK